MSANINDRFTKGSETSRPVVTYLSSTRNIGDSSISVNSLTGWPTTTAVHFIIYRTDATGKKIAGTQTDWKGVASGTTISNLVLKAGVDLGDSANAVVESSPTAAWADDIVTGLTTSVFNQDGTLQASQALVTPVVTSPTTKGLTDDWIGANESWSFASASTITVPTDATTKYQKGDRIKITQSATVKYFVVTAVASTVLTVTSPTGATVANSGITANAYAKNVPQGFASGLAYNPVKFSVYRNSAYSTTAGGFQAIPMDTKLYDTGGNVDVTTNKGRFTAPYNGFYQFNVAFSYNGTVGNKLLVVSLWKNGPTEVHRGPSFVTGGAANQGLSMSAFLQLAAGDTIDPVCFSDVIATMLVGAAPMCTWFDGYLVSYA